MLRFILRTTLIVAIFCGLLTSASFASVYLSVNGASTFVRDSDYEVGSLTFAEATYSRGYGFTGALGTWINIDVPGRIELEASYRINDIDEMVDSGGIPLIVTGDIQTMSLMLNAFRDYDLGVPVTPFFGLGAGFTEIDVNLGSLGSASDTVLAYQAMVGGSYPFSEKFFLDFQYRFFGTDEPEFESTTPGIDETTTSYQVHNTMLGLRFVF